MPEYDRIDISEGIDVSRTNKSKNVKFVIVGTLKILILYMNHIFLIAVMVYCKKLLVLIILLLFILKEMLTELTFGI